MGHSFEYMKEQLKGGKFNVNDLSLSDETANKMENAQNRESDKNLAPKKTIGSTLGEMGGAVNKSGFVIKSIIVIGLSIAAWHGVIKPAKNAITSAAADPAHYSANPLSSNFWNNKGDANAPVSEGYAKEWINSNVKPLHGIVKENLASHLDEALADKKLTLKETANLSQKISDLNHQFFGTEFPQADAVPITPKKPKM